MKEPIRHFFEKVGFRREEIREWVIGDKYVAIMLKNGNIGVCATLGVSMDESLFEGAEPDPDLPCHRIILNAWFNAIYNYERDYTEVIDIFDRIDFRKFSKIVMIGYFESLYEKFKSLNINLEVFDIQKESHILSGMENMKTSLHGAEVVILTGTTIYNDSFTHILKSTSDNSRVFLLGPSNILSEDMLGYRNISLIFGSVFQNNDRRVLEKIREGHGTRGFLKFLNKVYIVSKIYENEL